MKYLIDTANIEAIRYLNEFYPVAGVTTNPTLIAKENGDFWEIVKEIRNNINRTMNCEAANLQKMVDAGIVTL